MKHKQKYSTTSVFVQTGGSEVHLFQALLLEIYLLSALVYTVSDLQLFPLRYLHGQDWLRLVYLWAAVVQDLDVGTQRLVHDVHGHVITVGQIPQQVQHLVGHHAILVVLRQPADEFQKFLPLLFTCVGPARLRDIKTLVNLAQFWSKTNQPYLHPPELQYE